MNAPTPIPIDGLWQMVKAEMAGETAPELVPAKTVLELNAGEYLVRFDGEVIDRGSFEVGTTIEFATMTLHGLEGTNAGRTIPSIYQHVGERLRICYGLAGMAPTRFETELNSQTYLATYRRKQS